VEIISLAFCRRCATNDTDSHTHVSLLRKQNLQRNNYNIRTVLLLLLRLISVGAEMRKVNLSLQQAVKAHRVVRRRGSLIL
jgi:hypothetical protein